MEHACAAKVRESTQAETAQSVIDPPRPSKDVLAANLKLLQERPGLPRAQADIAKRAGLDQTTVSRTLRAANAISIDKLDGLAGAFGMQSWQLLAPGLEATVAGLSPKALEVALLFESLSVAKQDLLHATAKVLHDPDALEDLGSQEGSGD